MVSRANVYLAVKCGPDQSENNPFAGHPPPVPSRRSGPPRNPELITRREVVDLGNTTSRTVRQLIEYLQQSAVGYEQFRQLGLIRRSPSRRVYGINGVSCFGGNVIGRRGSGLVVRSETTASPAISVLAVMLASETFDASRSRNHLRRREVRRGR